jgi:hypothetical protein
MKISYTETDKDYDPTFAANFIVKVDTLNILTYTQQTRLNIYFGKVEEIELN